MLKSIICIAAGIVMLSAHAEVSASRPNIVLIMADDLAYGCVGFNGSKKIKTPQLDRMAKDGMRLDAMYAACPVCGPSRASLMFGQHLGHCKIRGNPKWSLRAFEGRGTVEVETSDRLLPEYLKEAGYATGCFGKWGLNENLAANGGHPNKHGFDEFWGFNTHLEAHFHWPDYDELNAHGTDPFDSDSDNDGLSDGQEINRFGTDPLDWDSDDDGLAELELPVVEAWGDNYYGQLNVPSDVTNSVFIAAGAFHNLALLADGTVRAWGIIVMVKSTFPLVSPM